MQTQCPQCHTAFRVSEEQLQLADGKVRCGQCMHVFVADEHFIDVPPPEPDVEDEIITPAFEIELEASEVELPDAMSIDELTPTNIEMTEIEVDEIEMPSLETLDEHTETDIEDHEYEDETIDETQTEELSDEEAPSLPSTDVLKHVVHSIAEPMVAANDTWQEDEENDDETIQSEPDDIPHEAIAGIESEPEPDEQITSPTEESLAEEPTDKAIPLLIDSFDINQLYPELDAAPVVERAQYTGLYSIAIILLLAVFSLQATYALRDTLAAQPALRMFMSTFCASFDCAITLPREPEKIVLTQSEIRSHSSQSGALLVKARMKNQSHFRQAYPILRLQFSDLDGKSMLGRDFLPEEYLPDDVNINAGMPINTDVNLSLELVDPGSQAVSFDFNLL